MHKLIVILLFVSLPGAVDVQPDFIKPLKEDVAIVSGFGNRYHPVLDIERLHSGVDYAVEEGTEVVAAAPGKVTQTGRRSTSGYIVIIEHKSGFETRYHHLSERQEVEVGEKVNQGELIGYSGITGMTEGAHLHFEIHKDGKAVDPATYLVD